MSVPNVRDDSRENQLLRALLAIQAIAEREDDSPKFGRIYSIAHGASGCCRSCTASELWSDLVNDVEEHAGESDLYNVETMLGKAKR